MTEFINLYQQLHIGATIRAALLIIIGFFVARILSTSLARAFRKRLRRQQMMLLRRFTFYFVLILFIATAIQELGFNLGTLLGATGILTVAIGIASQTSISNIVSGVFIIGEKPFEIGDIIKINEIEGEVMAIDLLSVKVRTYDNMMVRIPNEMLVKSAITNISYFPNRRVDLLFSVAYKEDLDHVKDVLFNIAEKNNYCLQDPKPTLLITGFGDSAIQLKFCVWAIRENYNTVKNSIQEDIKSTFTQVGIEMPNSSVAFHTKNDSMPIQIKIVP